MYASNTFAMNKRGILRGPSRPAKRELAELLRVNSTEAERLLWAHLRVGRLARSHWRRQQVIDGFVVDFDCHRAALVVEVDGTIHDAQTDYDAERDQILARRDLKIIRVPNDRVLNDLPALLDELRAMLPAPTPRHPFPEA
jgi:very-short-patch-repair endonuclease